MRKRFLILIALLSLTSLSGMAQKKKKANKAKASVENKAITKEDNSEKTTLPLETNAASNPTAVPALANNADSTLVAAEEPQDRVDTIYYNKNWKVTKNKQFASYYRLALYPADETTIKEFKTYYMSGELQSEGNFISLDSRDDAKSQFNESMSIYFKNGEVAEKRNYLNGKLDGDQTIYYANGNVKEHTYMKQGDIDGPKATFTEDGKVCTLTPFENGQAQGYYVIVDSEGNYSKYSLDTKQPILEAPQPNEILTEYKNGVAWPYYNKNGLIVGVSNAMVDDIGSYREIGVFIVNKSMNNIDIDPAQIEVYSLKGKKRKDYELVEVNEYDDKIKKLKKKNAKLKVKHKAVVETERENNVNANLGAKVFNAGTSNTLKEFQKRICNLRTIGGNNRMRYSEKMPEDLGYLERTTVHPGEVVSGYLYTSDRKAVDLYVNLKIDGINYLFNWKEDKKK